MYSIYAGIGSRKTPKEICEEFTLIGEKLAKMGLILRSGHAEGADTAFECGCDRAPFGRKEVYLPWKGFNGSDSTLYNIPDEAFRIADKYHPYFGNLKPAAQKLIARDCLQVLGPDLKTPVNFVICWTENGEMKGGTAQALKIAEAYRIPVFNFGDPEGRENFNKTIISLE